MSHLELSTTISDDDFNLLFALNWKCFSNDSVIAAFFPGGLDSACRSFNVQDFKHGIFGNPAPPTKRAYAVLKDLDTNSFVAFVSAKIYRGSKGIIDGDMAEEPPPIQLPRIKDKEERIFYEWYWNENQRLMRHAEIMQAPHVYVQLLGTDPEWRRKGAASRLMRWVLGLAKQEGLGRCVLLTSPGTLESRFYETLGFQVAERRRMVYGNGREGPPVVIMSKEMKISLELSTTIHDSEWNSLFLLNWTCFSPDPSMAAFSPGGVDPTYCNLNVENFCRRTFGGPIERLYAVVRNQNDKDLPFASFISARVYRGTKGVLEGNPLGASLKVELPRGPPEEDKQQAYYERHWTWVSEERMKMEVFWRPHVYVQRLCTHPRFRRRGLGTRLLEWVVDFVRREDLERIVLLASAEAIRSGFYEHLGFRVEDRRTYVDVEHGEGGEVVTMVREIEKNDSKTGEK